MSFGLGLASTADVYGPSAGSTFYQTQEKAPTSAQIISGGQGGGAAANLQPTTLFGGLGNVNPLLWIPIILGVLVLLKLLREWGTEKTHFSALKVDAYWFLMTVGAAVAGIPLVKGFLNKYRVPGLTEYVNNA